MSWICNRCETENPERLKICEVCDTPRESSPRDRLKAKLKEKYSDVAYNSFIRYHYLLLDSADNGATNAQYQVGEWFFNQGNTKSSYDCYKIAVSWYQKAALQGYYASQMKLALCYEGGYGVPQIKDEAMKWYKEAAKHGDEAAMRRYLKLKYASKTYKAVIRYRVALLSGADSGNRNFQYKLGEWFNSHNCQSSYIKEAVVWYTKAAKSGHGDAMQKLGECYENGFGVDINIKDALMWYKKAAKSGNMTACLKLTESYLYGRMVTKDIAESVKWCELAGSDISGVDLCNIGYAYEVGDGIPIDKLKAVEYYKKAAEKGEMVAQYNLGVCYEKGNGISANLDYARNWYKKAALQGYAQAQQGLSRIDSLIRNQKQDMIIEHFIISVIIGSIYGVFGYYALTEGLSKWGIQIPEVWQNIFQPNIFICIVVGIVITFLIKKDD